jgi:hypothetical protein
MPNFTLKRKAPSRGNAVMAFQNKPGADEGCAVDSAVAFIEEP